LALAARGHELYGDEMAAVTATTREVLPFRRSLSIRLSSIGERFAASVPDAVHEVFPDGGARIRVQPAALFRAPQGQSAPLAAVFFLRSFAAAARAERFRGGTEHLPLMSPLSCCLWNQPRSRRMFQVAGLLANTATFFVDLGTPEETAALIEQTILEKPWA
jgi:hypothetical protein